MTGMYILLGGIFIYATILVIIDAIGRRQERKAGKG